MYYDNAGLRWLFRFNISRSFAEWVNGTEWVGIGTYRYSSSPSLQNSVSKDVESETPEGTLYTYIYLYLRISNAFIGTYMRQLIGCKSDAKPNKCNGMVSLESLGLFYTQF